jgi:hypothetical protein
MPFFQQFPKVDFDFLGDGTITRITDIFRFVKADEMYFDDMSTYQYYSVPSGERPDVVSEILYGTPAYYWTFFIINEHLKTGLSGWPMGPTEFEDYMNLEYSGIVIDTEPVVVRGSDGQITEYRNSLAGKYSIGETISGSTSMASGILKEKNLEMSQLIIRNVTGNFRPSEFLVGSASGSIVTSSQVYQWRDAPHHYEDANGNPAYSGRFINEFYTAGGVRPEASTINLKAVSYLQYETELNDDRANIRVIRPELVYQFAKKFRELINA